MSPLVCIVVWEASGTCTVVAVAAAVAAVVAVVVATVATVANVAAVAVRVPTVAASDCWAGIAVGATVTFLAGSVVAVVAVSVFKEFGVPGEVALPSPFAFAVATFETSATSALMERGIVLLVSLIELSDGLCGAGCTEDC